MVGGGGGGLGVWHARAGQGDGGMWQPVGTAEKRSGKVNGAELSSTHVYLTRPANSSNVEYDMDVAGRRAPCSQHTLHGGCSL